MNLKSTKVVIIGVGNVGATCAYTIVNMGLCDQLCLIDMNQEKAIGEAMDLTHAVHFMNRNMQVYAGGYSDCSDADAIIVTASAPMDTSNDRLTWLAPSKKVMKSIVSSVMASGFSGIFIVVSNPVDLMTYYIQKLSGLPERQVIGSGTTLDTARLCCEIGSLFELNSKSVSAYVMGEHGDSEMVAWSTATVGGKQLRDVMEDNRSRAGDVDLDRLQEQTKKAGWEIFNRKHNTSYGIAASTCAILKSILLNENRIYPVSVMLRGQYGLTGVCLSVPTILDRTGAKEIVEIRLTKGESKNLKRSADVVRSCYDLLED